MKKKNIKEKKFKFPDFDKMSHEEEANWWDTHSFADFWNDLEDVEIIWDLEKPKDETVVIRLHKDIKDRLEMIARNKGINLSSLTRMWIVEKLQSFKP